MNNRDIQRERVRRYFLDAAKDIIINEGVSAVTAKKVGERAAYSYASIYNYFENQNALICEAVEEIAMECAEWVASNLEGTLAGQYPGFSIWVPYNVTPQNLSQGDQSQGSIHEGVAASDIPMPGSTKDLRAPTVEDRILALSFLMIEYNGRNPNVYAPFLSTEIDFRYFIKRDGYHFMHPAYELLMKELEKLDRITQEKRRLIADIMVYIFHSKMHFFIRYGTPESLEALHREVSEEVRYLLWP
ncbi:MAG: TetR/AcrR family transcriptional regulator [Spirochaetota bacterium]|jgi:AcrR family transcriptional regulator